MAAGSERQGLSAAVHAIAHELSQTVENARRQAELYARLVNTVRDAVAPVVASAGKHKERARRFRTAVAEIICPPGVDSRDLEDHLQALIDNVDDGDVTLEPIEAPEVSTPPPAPVPGPTPAPPPAAALPPQPAPIRVHRTSGLHPAIQYAENGDNGALICWMLNHPPDALGHMNPARRMIDSLLEKPNGVHIISDLIQTLLTGYSISATSALPNVDAAVQATMNGEYQSALGYLAAHSNEIQQFCQLLLAIGLGTRLKMLATGGSRSINQAIIMANLFRALLHHNAENITVLKVGIEAQMEETDRIEAAEMELKRRIESKERASRVRLNNHPIETRLLFDENLKPLGLKYDLSCVVGDDKTTRDPAKIRIRAVNLAELKAIAAPLEQAGINVRYQESNPEEQEPATIQASQQEVNDAIKEGRLVLREVYEYAFVLEAGTLI